ncbi:MAG: hydrogenase [Candidatus Aminicenantes bacterium]|nr:hydrogenase [Candidatus Aminicenantes bacterium]
MKALPVLKTTRDLKNRISGLKKRRTEDKRPVLTVSAGTCGRARGSLKVISALEKSLKASKLEKNVRVRVTGCHGFCEAEPNIIIQPQDLFYQKVDPKRADDIVGRTVKKKQVLEDLLYKDPATGGTARREHEIPFYKKQNRFVLGDNALIDPTRIDDYFSIGGYGALLKVLTKMSPEEVIGEVKTSGLRGRGGAGFPTGRKWEVARAQKAAPKYIICNADEGDPGAYMDRSLLEGNPHRVLEGMMIGAFAIGAREGIIYVRDEYPLAVENVTAAIEALRGAGLLGENILGTGFDFDFRIAKGAGAFVCGEETAMIASIEGKVGEPRQRPPYPAIKGLLGKPTVINNVETWGTVPLVITKGGAAFASIGTAGSKGTKIFSLVGKINNTGLVEVPMGITLREIIYDIGGGIPGDKRFKAVQTGGPAGGCLPASKIDLPIDYESLAAAGSIMGSGGMIVMDESTCMVDVAKYFLNFLRDESCGKCLSCREGTQRLWEIVERISKGQGKDDDLVLLEELAESVKDASMCGLGQNAANPVLSTLKYFKAEYRQHIRRKKCPALVCKEIVSSPCHYVCPIGQEASTYIALVSQGRYEEAYRVILKDNPLPSICARVCHHPCELACRAGESGEPISIRAIKRFVLDWAEANGVRYVPEPLRQNKEKVAIIGGGPAGLTAGYFLARKGYRPTIYEALPVSGGMTAVGIPDHRLPKEIVAREVDFIKASGVTIRTGQVLGRDITIDGLFRDGYKAVFCATGAGKSLAMGIPGEEAEGVLHSLEYLREINLGRTVPVGKRVCVVGGGNSAIDAARAAHRQPGCEKVSILYRRTKAEMPALAEEVDAAIEEGIDLQFLVAPVRVITAYGKATAIECVRMRLGDKDSSGRRRPVPVEGSNFTMPLDTLILAISERPDTSYIGEGDEIRRVEENIHIDEETAMTTRAGVFAGGDAVTGPNMVVEAMAAGKVAAEMIEKYIRGLPMQRDYWLTRPSTYVPSVSVSEAEAARAERPKIPTLSPAQRRKNFREVERTLSEASACREARRCLRCDLETEDGKAALGGNP